jgi:hypothetical protein
MQNGDNNPLILVSSCHFSAPNEVLKKGASGFRFQVIGKIPGVQSPNTWKIECAEDPVPLPKFPEEEIAPPTGILGVIYPPQDSGSSGTVNNLKATTSISTSVLATGT